MHEKANEILELGNIYASLYSRCWDTAIDCYSRHFQSAEQQDRDAMVQMTNFLFSACAEALSNSINTDDEPPTV